MNSVATSARGKLSLPLACVARAVAASAFVARAVAARAMARTAQYADTALYKVLDNFSASLEQPRRHTVVATDRGEDEGSRALRGLGGRESVHHRTCLEKASDYL